MKEITEEEFMDLTLEENFNFTGIVNWNDGAQIYYQNGKRHRMDGPAAVWSDGQVSYWINGKRVSREAQELYHSLMKLKGLV